MSPSRKAAVLAEYILSIGLPLPSKLDELYEVEIKPAVDAASLPGKSNDLRNKFQLTFNGKPMRFLPRGATFGAKERVQTALCRHLRALVYVAVGRRVVSDTAGQLQIIEPRCWENLVVCTT